MSFKPYLFIWVIFIGGAVEASACDRPEPTDVPQLTATDKPPTPTQTVAQVSHTSTPLLPFSQEEYELGLIIYDDRFIKPWSCNADREFQESKVAFQGEESIQVTLVPDGAVYFNNNRPPYIPFYTWLAFYFNGGPTADQQLYVEMKAGFRMPDREVELGERVNQLDYVEDDQLRPWHWYHVAIPLSLLDPQVKDFVWIEIGDASGNGASTFYIDDIRFVPAVP